MFFVCCVARLRFVFVIYSPLFCFEPFYILILFIDLQIARRLQSLSLSLSIFYKAACKTKIFSIYIPSSSYHLSIIIIIIISPSHSFFLIYFFILNNIYLLIKVEKKMKMMIMKKVGFNYLYTPGYYIACFISSIDINARDNCQNLRN